MDKFSIYEFMSFFLPGVLVCFIALQLLPSSFLFFKTVSEFLDGLLFTIASLITGLVLHRITFLLLRFTRYEKLMIQPISEIILNNDDFLRDNFELLNKKYNKKGLTAEKLFSKAYYYLEFHDKIATSKIFQSMYFFLRNIISVIFIVTPILIVLIVVAKDASFILKLLVFNIVALPLLVYTARFYRVKMVDRVFNTYLISKECKQN